MLQQLLRLCTTGIGPYAVIGFVMFAAYLKHVRTQAKIQRHVATKTKKESETPSWYLKRLFGATEEDDIF